MTLGERLDWSEQRIRVAAANLWAFGGEHVFLSILSLGGSLLALPLVTLFVSRASMVEELWRFFLYGFVGPLLVIIIGFIVFWLRAKTPLRNSQPAPAYHRRTGLIIISLCICLTAFGSEMAWHFWPKPQVITLKGLFSSDWNTNYMTGNAEYTLSTARPPLEPIPVTFETKMVLDFPHRARWLVYYIPQTSNTKPICDWILQNTDFVLRDFDSKTYVVAGGPNDVGGTTQAELVFSKRIYIYYEWLLSNGEISDIMYLAKDKGIDVVFRGKAYLNQYQSEHTAGW